MRGIEFGVDSSFAMDEQIVQEIKDTFGKYGVVFHHTIKRPDTGMTYGGLHEDQAGAQEERRKLAAGERKRDFSEDHKWKFRGTISVLAEQYQEERAHVWKDAPVINLEIGQEYHAWGKGNLIHGETDATHGS